MDWHAPSLDKCNPQRICSCRKFAVWPGERSYRDAVKFVNTPVFGFKVEHQLQTDKLDSEIMQILCISLGECV